MLFGHTEWNEFDSFLSGFLPEKNLRGGGGGDNRPLFSQSKNYCFCCFLYCFFRKFRGCKRLLGRANFVLGGAPSPVAESQLVSIFFGHLKTEISFDTEADSLLLNFFLATHSLQIKHLLGETESNIQFIAFGQGNIRFAQYYFVQAQSTWCWTRSSPLSLLLYRQNRFE